MRTPSKIITALALAGLAVAGGAAFTAGGVADTAGDNQFIGGTVSQAVQGAKLTSIVYDFADDAQLQVKTIQLTFDDSTGYTLPAANQVSIVPAGGNTGILGTAWGRFNVVPTRNLSDLGPVYTFTWTSGTNAIPGYVGLTGVGVTVADATAMGTIV